MGGISNPGFFGTVGVEVTTVHIFRRDSADSETARIIDVKGQGFSSGTRLPALAVSFVYSAFRWFRE